MTIVEFIEARLAEDEAAAKAALWHHPEPWIGAFKQVTSEPTPSSVSVVATTETAQAAHLIEAWSPARVLREVEAKRAILRAVDVLTGGEKSYLERLAHTDAEDARYVITRDMLRHLASVWSDHEAFQEEWRA